MSNHIPTTNRGHWSAMSTGGIRSGPPKKVSTG